LLSKVSSMTVEPIPHFPHFQLQPRLFEDPDLIALYCAVCGRNFDCNREFLRLNPRTRIGCPNCGVTSVCPEIPEGESG
jgi:hypothetical protein